MDYIWKSQSDSNKKLQKIKKRQEKLGRYLVNMNNEMVKLKNNTFFNAIIMKNQSS